jgi:hypothetical protein
MQTGQHCYKIAVSSFALSKKLPQGDPIWHKFNSSFENLELDVPGIMNAVYAGRAITTQHKDHWRTSANYLCGQHIGLDFDAGDETSSLDYLLRDKFVSRYAAFAYTTISHTPEHPRARVIFTLDAPIMQAKNYTLAAAALLWLFGTADRQCKDAARFFYGAPGCEMVSIGNDLPLETVKKLIQNYQETGVKEKRRSLRKDYAPTTDQREVADALQKIPAWGIDYDEWVQVLMGLHAGFGDDAIGLAIAWADGKPGEVEQKWRSFKQDGNGQGAITLATVFGIAKRFGWQKGRY